MIRNFDKETNGKKYIMLWESNYNLKKEDFIYEKRFYNSNYKNIKLEQLKYSSFYFIIKYYWKSVTNQNNFCLYI